jgi:translation initiation factor 2 subunit 1
MHSFEMVALLLQIDTSDANALSLPFAGYIDLSKRRVSAEEVGKCEEQYEKGKTVDSIVTQVAKKTGMEPEVIYEKVVWPLSKKYGHAHDAFKLAVT